MSGFCIICDEWFDDNITTDCCDEKVCTDCFKQHCRVALGNGKIEINCPRYSCQKILSYQQTCRNLGPDDELINILDQNILKAANSSKFCCQECNGKCVFFDEICIQCQDCHTSYCIQCRDKEHNYSSDCPWNDIQENDNVKRCPRCNMGIEKTDGCDAVRCPQCKCKFCWNCCMLYKNIECLDQHRENCAEFKSFNPDEQSDCDDE